MKKLQRIVAVWGRRDNWKGLPIRAFAYRFVRGGRRVNQVSGRAAIHRLAAKLLRRLAARPLEVLVQFARMRIAHGCSDLFDAPCRGQEQVPCGFNTPAPQVRGNPSPVWFLISRAAWEGEM